MALRGGPGSPFSGFLALNAKHVDTWTAGHQARLAALAYMAATGTALTFSAPPCARWSKGRFIAVSVVIALRGR